MSSQSHKVNYHDQWLIIIGVPVINLLNYYLTYFVISFNPHFIFTCAIDTAQGYAAWYACRGVIRLLDRYYFWERNIIVRMVMQVPLVCLTLLGVTLTLTKLVALLDGGQSRDALYTFDLYIFLIWGFFINVLYLSLYLYGKLIAPHEKYADDHQIWIKNGKDLKQVNLDQASAFIIEHENVYGIWKNTRQFIPGFTLDKIEKRVDQQSFFRVNRQFLIHRKMINDIRKGDNGKLIIELVSYSGLPPSITISRLRANSIRAWLEEVPTPA
jgi:hypothetical protein